VRDAGVGDIEPMCEILNTSLGRPEVSWRETPATLEDIIAWFPGGASPKIELIVGVDAGDRPIGFASAEFYHPASGFRRTASHGIYCDYHRRGGGTGTLMLAELRARLQRKGFLTQVARIDASNEPSIRFHRARGFRTVGKLPGVGVKGDETRDLVEMMRAIADARPGAFS